MPSIKEVDLNGRPKGVRVFAGAGTPFVAAMGAPSPRLEEDTGNDRIYSRRRRLKWPGGGNDVFRCLATRRALPADITSRMETSTTNGSRVLMMATPLSPHTPIPTGQTPRVLIVSYYKVSICTEYKEP